jgi:hypothetical protein
MMWSRRSLPPRLLPGNAHLRGPELACLACWGREGCGSREIHGVHGCGGHDQKGSESLSDKAPSLVSLGARQPVRVLKVIHPLRLRPA